MTNTNIMRMSRLYVPTLKEDPTDAEIASHRLLLRAGMIRKTASGVYTFLPLGKRVLAKVENIVREEMDAIGAQEIMMPAVGTITAPSSCASWIVTTTNSALGPPTRNSSQRSCVTNCAPTSSCRCRCTRSR